MADLLLVSDVLLTDYSSVAFDYAFLRRPMVFYAPDRDHYAHVDPGTYVDLARIAPGPVLDNPDEIVRAVRASRDGAPDRTEAYEEFFKRFCEAENGRAAEIVVEQVWGPASTQTGGRTGS
jgi:CDP-glycerol glycerophosphotransferase